MAEDMEEGYGAEDGYSLLETDAAYGSEAPETETEGDSKTIWISQAVSLLSSYNMDLKADYEGLFYDVEDPEKARLYFRAIMRDYPVAAVSAWKEEGLTAQEMEEAMSEADNASFGDTEDELRSQLWAAFIELEKRVGVLETEAAAARKKNEDVLNAADGALRKTLEMASRLLDEREKTIADLREEVRKLTGQGSARGEESVSGGKKTIWRRIFGDIEDADDVSGARETGRILMEFQQKYLTGNMYDDEQKDYLISLMEKGTPVEIIEKVAAPALSVQEMERMRALHEKGREGSEGR